MLTDRANAICLLEILKEYSDTEHILSMRDILSKLNTIYGLRPDRRTVYSALALLGDLGYDISMYDENGTGYYLRERELEQAEVMLLTDAVYSFPFLPARQSEQLIGKLQKLLSVYQRKKYRHLQLVRQERKTENRQVFWTMEQIDEAITQKKQVAFTYLTFGLDKKLHPRRKEPYIVSPCQMIYLNEHYYLVCRSSEHENTGLYRIDRICDLILLDTAAIASGQEQTDVQNAVYAFAGKAETITMRCSRLVLNDVLNKFGTGVTICSHDGTTFTVRLTAPPHGVKFWALQYLPYVEIVQPQWLRDAVIQSIRENPYWEGANDHV